MDRSKGTFTHYYYNAAYPEKLSRPPQYIEGGVPQDHIAFITEDATGGILIGTYIQGINYYNPISREKFHTMDLSRIKPELLLQIQAPALMKTNFGDPLLKRWGDMD